MSIKKSFPYQDKEWLNNKYNNDKLSISQINKLCGVTTIYYWLKKFNILCRSDSEAVHLRKVNHCKLSEEAINWINGELLGDGCLISRSPHSARFLYTSKHLEYCQYVSDKLESFGILRVGKITKRYGDGWVSYNCTSLSYEELYPIYKQWYPKGKKISPKDIRLTPITCRQWHIGDGCLIKPKKGNPYITLATNGFPIVDVEWLKKQLIKIGFKVIRQPSNILRISSYSIKDFIKYIGECPVKCYQYKFNYSK